GVSATQEAIVILKLFVVNDLLLSKKKKKNPNAPSIQHNLILTEYYLNPRAGSASASQGLEDLLESYKSAHESTGIIQYNCAQLLLLRQKYQLAEKMLLELIGFRDLNQPKNDNNNNNNNNNTTQDNQSQHVTLETTTDLYIRSCCKLLSTYFHHEMYEKAEIILKDYLSNISKEKLKELPSIVSGVCVCICANEKAAILRVLLHPI
ncbi:hypothetical protein RFI_18152, partial [Reticulomyxa filosa]